MDGLIKFVVGLFKLWSFNLASWAAAIGGIAYFLGFIEEVETFFKDNRQMMMGVLLLHFALCAMIYHASDTKRVTKRVANLLGRQ